MTVSSELSSVTRNWTGVETVFSTGFKAADPTYVKVSTATATLVRGTHYTSSIDVDGLLVVTPLGAMPAAPQTLLIERDTTILQETVLENGSNFDAPSIERMLDRVVMVVQEDKRRSKNSETAATAALANVDATLAAANEALANVEAAIANGPVLTVNGRHGVVTLAKSDVGLSAVDNTADADKPLSTPQISYLNQRYERTIHSLTGKDDPADITTALLQAAWDAAPDLRLLKILDRDYSFNAKMLVTNRPLALIGTSKKSSRIKWIGGTSGFQFTASDTTADHAHGLDIRDLTMHSMVAGAYGVDAAWNLLPFSLHNYGEIDVDFTVENSASSFERSMRLKHAQGLRISTSMQNHRDVIAGAGIEFQGFNLANKLEWIRAGYHAVSLLVSAFEVQMVTVSGRTGTFAVGETITTSGGATGVIAGMLSADQFVIELLTGSITATHMITASGGATATIDAVQLREWGSEGYYIGDIEFIGCQNGLRVQNTEKIAKPGVGIFCDKLHVNGTGQPLYVAFCSQVEMQVEGYSQTVGADAMTILSCDRVTVNGRLTNLTGGADDGTALRVVVGDGTYGSNACSNISGQLDVVGFAAEDVVDSGVVNYSVTFGPRSTPSGFTPVVTAQTPGSVAPTIASTDCHFEYLTGKLLHVSYDILFSNAGTGNANAVLVTLPPGVALARRVCLHGNEQGFDGRGIWARNEWPDVTHLGVAFSSAPGISLWNNATRLVFSGTIERA